MSEPVELSGLGKAALAYAQLGWQVFPLYPRDVKPMRLCDGCGERLTAKRTACSKCGREHGPTSITTTDAEQIRRWWTAEPKANIGIRCGGDTRLVVVNCTADGSVHGEASLAALEAKHGPLPVTPRQRTSQHKQPDGSMQRGVQYAFEVGPIVTVHGSVDKVGPGITVHGEDAYIVAAPSLHPSGVRYEWDADRKPSKTPRAMMPEWLLDLCTGKPKPPPRQRIKRPETPGVSQAWVNAVLDGEYARVVDAEKSRQVKALSAAAFKLGQIVGGKALDEGTARAQLESAAEVCGLAEEQGAEEVEKIITAGMNAGVSVPREAPEDKPKERAPYQPPYSPKPQLRAVGGSAVPASEAEAVKASDLKPVTSKGWIPEDWHKYVLFKSDEHRVMQPKVLTNAIACLMYRRELADLFVLNKRSMEVIVTRKPMWTVNGDPYPRQMLDVVDVVGTAAHLETLGLRLGKEAVDAAINYAAKEREFDPVMDKLTSFVWDGIPRLDFWLTELLGADDNDFVKQAGAKWMIAACARIMNPGCKFDHMLVLVGDQGLEKSTVLRILAETLAIGVYSDRLSPLKDKDSMLELFGKVIIEMAELAVLKGADIDTIKRFLSAQDDNFRLPYGRRTMMAKRGCVFAGTVNPDGMGFLTDPTGGRRFWPVKVTKHGAVAIAREAPQLWAEALHRYREGERWWIEDPEVMKLAYDAVQEHTSWDIWAPEIDRYIEQTPRVKVEMVLAHLGVKMDRQDARMQQRVIHHLKKRGMVSNVKKINGENSRDWVMPSDKPTPKSDLFEEDPGPEER